MKKFIVLAIGVVLCGAMVASAQVIYVNITVPDATTSLCEAATITITVTNESGAAAAKGQVFVTTNKCESGDLVNSQYIAAWPNNTHLTTNMMVPLSVVGDNTIIATLTSGVATIHSYSETVTVTRTSIFDPYNTNTTYTYYTVVGATTSTVTSTYGALTIAQATNPATYSTFKTNLVGVIGLANDNDTWHHNNLTYQIGGTKQAINTTSSYWYGQRVVLYNGLYTNYVNNEPLPNALLLTQLYYAAHNVEALRIRYTTFENDSLYSCPGLRMGHVGVNSDSTNRYPVVLPAFGTSETNDYLMIVWPSSYSDQVFHNGYPSDTNIYHRVFDASLVQYFETNNAVYTTKTVAVGAAAYGIFGSNKVEIILVSTNGSDLSKFQLGSASARPWWIYANGRDFICYTNNVIGNYTNNVNQPALSN